MSFAHIFLFANLVDDIIDGKHNLGGEGGFATSALQILIDSTGEKVPYRLAGQIGNDASGKFLIRTLTKMGVDVSSLAVTDIATCQAVTKGVKHAEFIGFNGGPLCRFSAAQTKKHFMELKAPGWMFLSSNTLVDDETWAQLRSIMSITPRLIFLDLNWRWALVKRGKLSKKEFINERVAPFLNHIQVLKGTRAEIQWLEKKLEGTKTDLFEAFPGLQWILRTNGSEGISLSTRTCELSEKGLPVTLIQDTGAGDVVSGTLLFELGRLGIRTKDQLQYMHEDHIRRTLKNANHMAAMAIQGFGIENLHFKMKSKKNN